MPKTVYPTIANAGTSNAMSAGAGTKYVVQTPDGTIYVVYRADSYQTGFVKSVDGGISWSDYTALNTGTNDVWLSVWYDRWSGIAAGLIHVAYCTTGDDNIFYRTIDTENSDTLSTETIVFDGLTTAAEGQLTICRARGGNVYIRGCIDAGVEGGFFRLPNANVPSGAWDAPRTINEALATQDQAILMPGFAADDQDMILIFWDASANEISRQLYDDSANAWSETSISTGMVETNAGWPHFAATPDLTNSQIILTAWNGVDTANADLKCWTITESAITAKTDVVANGTDDQGLCGIALCTDTGHWWVFYGGRSDGSNTWPTSMEICLKVSADAGSTWGAEQVISQQAFYVTFIGCIPRFSSIKSMMFVLWAGDMNRDLIRCIVTSGQPRAQSLLGV